MAMLFLHDIVGTRKYFYKLLLPSEIEMKLLLFHAVVLCFSLFDAMLFVYILWLYELHTCLSEIQFNKEILQGIRRKDNFQHSFLETKMAMIKQ